MISRARPRAGAEALVVADRFSLDVEPLSLAALFCAVISFATIPLVPGRS